MLFNLAWDKTTTLLDRWIAWLETKEPDERYEWNNNHRCACAQFYGGGAWTAQNGFSVLNKIARGEQRDDARGRYDDPAGWTFGACLERAKRYKAQEHLGWMAQ